MNAPNPPKAPAELGRTLARRILAQMGENGKPPEHGISNVNVGNETYLKLIDDVYVQDLVRSVEGSSLKLVQGIYGAGKTHFLFCVRDLAWRSDLLTAFVTLSPKESPFHRPLAIYRAVAQRIELPRGPDGEETRGIDDVIRHDLAARVAADGEEAARAWIDAQAGAGAAVAPFVPRRGGRAGARHARRRRGQGAAARGVAARGGAHAGAGQGGERLRGAVERERVRHAAVAGAAGAAARPRGRGAAARRGRAALVGRGQADEGVGARRWITCASSSISVGATSCRARSSCTR